MKIKGFTLIELLGVITIIGIIALITVPAVDMSVKKAKQKAYDRTLDTIYSASRNWVSDNKLLVEEKTYVSLILSDLKEQGYLDYDIKNPSTSKCLSNRMQINITKNGKKYDYYLVGERLVDGTSKDCLTLKAAPTLYLIGGNEVDLEINTTYSDLGVVAFDPNGIDITSQVTTNGGVQNNTLGSYELIYNVSYNNLTKSVFRIVNVIDTVKPVIIGANDITIPSSNMTFNILAGVTVTDNSGNPNPIKTKSNLVLGVKGDYKVTYIASDKSGNTTTVIRNVKVSS